MHGLREITTGISDQKHVGIVVSQAINVGGGGRNGRMKLRGMEVPTIRRHRAQMRYITK